MHASVESSDENKIITLIRKGENSYENESEIARNIFSYKKAAFSLFVGDIAVYDLMEDRWCENTAKGGVSVKLGDKAKVKVTYGYVDIIDDSKNESNIETKLTFYF